MRDRAPFNLNDLEDLDTLFMSKAERVVPLRDVVAGDRGPNVIGMRHDCDNAQSLVTATHMAAWEQERGYRSTYYILHSAPYWDAPGFEDYLEEIASCGHEIGIHANALAEAFRQNRDPDDLLFEALARLRALGHEVIGAAGHGDPLCSYHAAPGEEWFANDEQFLECKRGQVGDTIIEGGAREINRGAACLLLQPRPLADFGLKYEALFCALPHYFRFSDSGGKWNPADVNGVARLFDESVKTTTPPQNDGEPKQLHILWHPDHWADAFAYEKMVTR
jgi:hypothetical protein